MLPDIYIALLIIFACSILVSILFQYLKQPSIVGFLLTGILVGPHALALLESVDQIETLAEVGVAMLLFTIGMEFSIKDLLKSKSMALIGGLGQLGITIAVCAGICLALGMPPKSALFLGFLICLSSTAIGLSLLQKYDSMASAMGRLCLLILIFQDLMMVPLMLMVPVLGGEAMPAAGASHWQLLFKGVGVVVLIIVTARWAMPWAMKHIVASRSKELFTIALVTLCIAICSLTVWAGLSLAMGAFIAGLMIASSPYNHQAIGYIIPLRDIFTCVFFVSIGMLLDVHFLLQHPLMVIGATLAIMLGKTVIAGGVALFLGLPIAQSVLGGLAISQVSEFSFVLASTGMDFNLLSENGYQLFLASAVLTMIITPLAFSLARGYSVNWRNNWTLRGRERPEEQPVQLLKDHVVIVGFGPTGRMVARAAGIASIPYVVVEMNAATVREQREKGENIIFGDAANDTVMEYVNIGQARVLVVTAATPFLINRAVSAARRMNPSLYIISRVRFMQESAGVMALGANEVVTEEFETALDVFSRVLRQLSVPLNDISRLVHQLKHENYSMLLTHKPQSANYMALQEYLPGHEIVILRVEKGSSADGSTLIDLGLRGQYGVNIMAVKRGNVVDSHINFNTRLLAGDLVVALGPPASIEDVQHKFFMLSLLADKVE